MLLRAFGFVIHVGYCSDRYAEDAVCWRRNPSGTQLLADARIIQQRRRIVVPSADNERDLILFLKVVEFFGKFRKLIERANGACA